jgi:hypothetical protein
MDSNFNHCGASRVNIRREVEASLRRLQTDYIDLYQVHGWDINTPLEETVRTLDDLVRQGKVRYIGNPLPQEGPVPAPVPRGLLLAVCLPAFPSYPRLGAGHTLRQ